MNQYNAIILLATCLTVSCSSSIETSGQVLLDNFGGPKKIENVRIYVISEENLLNSLQSSVPEIRTEYVRLYADHQLKTEFLAQAVARGVKSQDLAFQAAGFTAPPTWPGSDSQVISSATKMLEASTKLITNAKKSHRESEELLNGLANGSNIDFYLPKVIQNVPFVATSGADGKFMVTLDRDKRVAIIAKKDRSVWLVWVNPKKGEQILLNSNNLNGTQCETCVFNKEHLDTTLAFIPAAITEAQTK